MAKLTLEQLETSIATSLGLADTALQPSDNISELTNDSGFITGYTVTEGDVTQHQSALSITESQIFDLGSYADASHTHTLSDITDSGTAASSNTGTTSGTIPVLTTGGVIASGRISQTSIVQHESALTITESQISDLGSYATTGHTHTESDITDLGTYLEAGDAVMGTIVHGATAATSRPTGFDVVTWVGSVEPTNAVNDDIWVDTSA